ncbi:stage II sporulation protein R [Oikeobacillus pervagus]|uniref:Stage II sporulation protein R n=1 Tax=Oikeobacillus pervagus TaxID=1325931 RepID=A0AAJ1WI90_9BACI|nr:stage II sporulation protein R [Oikeobacillus pervagus]MDQ0214158.1 stage II sporulation protein R [Oikeobacillus pervagus]
MRKRKITAVAYLLLLTIGTILSLYIPKQETAAQDTIVIPNEAIRLRILANSDSSEDQQLKRKIRDEVNVHITKWVSDLTSLEDARSLLKEKLPEIQQIAKQVMEREKMNQELKVDFGKVKFPTKLYGQFLYPAGEYEAVLITLGEGEGANWWCVLYPPLCFLDFSNGVAVGPGVEEDVEASTIKEGTEKVETERVSEEEIQEESVEKNMKEEPINEGIKEELPIIHEEEQEKQQEIIVQKVENMEEDKKSSNEENEEDKQPVYVEEEDEEVEVKFFVVEMAKKLFK